MKLPYTITIYTGDYKARQIAANRDKALGYFEQHFNSVSDPGPRYCHAKVATNASKTSRAMAEWYARRVAKEFNVPVGFDNGVDAGGRGNGNLIHTAMPAILLEPLFVSNPEGAGIVKSLDGQKRLAECLAETVRTFFPKGGRIAFSIGHKYKTSSPNDRGAPVLGGGTEADYAERVINIAKQILEAEVTQCRP